MREVLGTIHSTKIQTGPTGTSDPPQKVNWIFRNFSGWTEPIYCVLDRNFRKFWSNGSRPLCSLGSVHTCPFLFENGDSPVWPTVHRFPVKTVTETHPFKKTLSRVAVIENTGLSFSRAKTEVFEYDEPPQDQLSWISAGYSSAQIFC